MYSKQEASILRQQFWTNFGQYLAPVPASTGSKINWINYKTGIKNINFKMDAGTDHVYIAIEITHNDREIHQTYFNYLEKLKPELEDILSEKWTWEPGVSINGKMLSRVYHTGSNVNILNQTGWPEIISFLKHRIILLDRFWTANKEIFEMLG